MISEDSKRLLEWAISNRPELCGKMAELDILLYYLPELNKSFNFVETPIDGVEQMFYTEREETPRQNGDSHDD